jgi:hypothetical protein
MFMTNMVLIYIFLGKSDSSLELHESLITKD